MDQIKKVSGKIMDQILKVLVKIMDQIKKVSAPQKFLVVEKKNETNTIFLQRINCRQKRLKMSNLKTRWHMQ